MTCVRRVGVFIANSYAFGQGVIQGVSQFCKINKGWKLAIALGDEKNVLKHLSPHLDGVVAGIRDHEIAATLNAWGKPCVDVFADFTPSNIPQVYYDLGAVGRVGAEHLLKLGFKRFAFCGLLNNGSSRLRQKAFEETIGKAGYQCLTHQVDSSTVDWALIWKAIADWVVSLPKPIGLMAAKDSLALEVLEACNDLGIRVPAQVAVLGAENDSLQCERANPPLSSVDPGFARVGFQAASVLEGMMSGKSATHLRICVPPLGVVGRASTNVMHQDDPQIFAALQYVQEHACDPMQINDILDHLPMSRRTLQRRFIQARGHSLHEEIRRVQIQQAMGMLAQTNLSLDQVARASGFNSAAWMVRVFRKELGITPGEHRRCSRQLSMAQV